MSIDYAKALKNYGWDNLINTIHADPEWQRAASGDHGAGNVAVNIPGIGPVTLDDNGRINALDMNSALDYQKTGNAPVYNTIWDGRDQEMGAFNGSDPATYQVSHGGMSADKLGLLAAAAITAGIGTGYIPGMESAGAGAGVGGGGLDVSGLGLEQFSSGLPDVATLGVDGTGALSYPGMEGYISPDALSGVNYSNEGAHYPTTESTATSPINATTGPNAAPTVDLSSPSASDALKKLATPQNLAKIATALKGGAAGSAGGFGFSGVPNELSNMTPQMLQVAAAPQQQQQASVTPFQIGDYQQPNFSANDSQIAKLAKMLQEE